VIQDHSEGSSRRGAGHLRMSLHASAGRHDPRGSQVRSSCPEVFDRTKAAFIDLPPSRFLASRNCSN